MYCTNRLDLDSLNNDSYNFVFFMNLLECERKLALDVNVGIITFGRENKFLRHCSNRYYSLKKSLGKYIVQGYAEDH